MRYQESSLLSREVLNILGLSSRAYFLDGRGKINIGDFKNMLDWEPYRVRVGTLL
jgi:hypothetical protein